MKWEIKGAEKKSNKKGRENMQISRASSGGRAAQHPARNAFRRLSLSRLAESMEGGGRRGEGEERGEWGEWLPDW